MDNRADTQSGELNTHSGHAALIRAIESAAARFKESTGRDPARVGLTTAQRDALGQAMAAQLGFVSARVESGDTVAGLVIFESSEPGPHIRG